MFLTWVSCVVMESLAINAAKGVGDVAYGLTVGTALNAHDLLAATGSVAWNFAGKDVYNWATNSKAENWYPELRSPTVEAYNNGTSQFELIASNVPIANVGVMSYHMTTSVMKGDWNGAARQTGGIVGGFAVGAGVKKYGGYGLELESIGGPKYGPLAAQQGSIGLKVVRPNTATVPTSSNDFLVAKHGDMPSPRPGQQSHHGVMSAWMKKNFPAYDPDLAPAVLMPEANHRATFGVYNTWRANAKKEMGGTFDWGKVSEPNMRVLSEKMFDAAKVPSNTRQTYWDWFDRMKGALSE